ncbi:MAG: hypothetical protein H6867_09670 [Rhodospirillales bacterium]|nr:hypothetical protein [Rhodospirillales bacterium]
MIKNIFGMRAAPAVIAMDKLYRDLHLKDPRFESDPDSHIAVLDVLGEYSLRGSSHFGPARSYYADPEKRST